MKITAELRNIYKQDQKDRSFFDNKDPDKFDWAATKTKDKERLLRVKELDKQKLINKAEDLFYAAMIYQHGKTSDDYRRAMELTEKGMKLGNQKCKSLYPKTVDRYLLSSGRAQIWGTQWQFNKDKVWVLIKPFDKKAKTEKERLDIGVNIARQSKELNRG